MTPPSSHRSTALSGMIVSIPTGNVVTMGIADFTKTATAKPPRTILTSVVRRVPGPSPTPAAAVISAAVSPVGWGAVAYHGARDDDADRIRATAPGHSRRRRHRRAVIRGLPVRHRRAGGWDIRVRCLR